MSFRRIAPVMAALAALAALAAAAPAGAADGAGGADDGEVVVFQQEFAPLTVFEDPSGCLRLPAGAHVITNRTERVITIYADPACVVPIEPVARIKPGYGTHVSAVGSVRA